MAKERNLKTAGIISGILAVGWAVLSLKFGFRPFRSIRVTGQADGPTATFVAVQPKGQAAQVMFRMVEIMPLILAAVSLACFLIRKKNSKKG